MTLLAPIPKLLRFLTFFATSQIFMTISDFHEVQDKRTDKVGKFINKFYIYVSLLMNSMQYYLSKFWKTSGISYIYFSFVFFSFFF